MFQPSMGTVYSILPPERLQEHAAAKDAQND